MDALWSDIVAVRSARRALEEAARDTVTVAVGIARRDLEAEAAALRQVRAGRSWMWGAGVAGFGWWWFPFHQRA